MAARTGWQPSKVSRLETGKTPPADADIRAWCAACEMDELAPDLIAAGRAAASMYREWRRLQRAGLKYLQNSYVPSYARTKEFRVYSSTVVPGMLQTPDYALAMLRSVAAFHGGVGDVEAAVQARMERSEMVRNSGSRLVVVLEESVLRHVLGGAEVMAAQLGPCSRPCPRRPSPSGSSPSAPSARTCGPWRRSRCSTPSACPSNY
ncbi:Scr1 family TA system antitoxin-like transcriptional regulator [Streptomyces albidoflavus]